MRVRLNLCVKLLSEKLQSEGNERDGAPGRPKGHHTIGSYHQLGVQSAGDMPGWHSAHSETVQSMPHPCGSSHGSTSGLGPIKASLHEDHAQYVCVCVCVVEFIKCTLVQRGAFQQL